MARMVSRYISPKKCLETGERHIHLANQECGLDNKYSQAFKPKYDTLKEKLEKWDEMRRSCLFAYDKVYISKKRLLNATRTCLEHIKQFRRDNHGAIIHASFDEIVTYSTYSKMKLTKLLSAIENLVYRFKQLDDGHPLYHFTDDLGNVVNTTKLAIAAYEEAQYNSAKAKVETQCAQDEVIKQYKRNYFEANIEMGRDCADDLFPILRRKKLVNDIEEVEVEDISEDRATESE